ncbi:MULTISPECIES: hypothetical protein [Pseudomonas syringae group]|uniref:DUF805 domain-containing protein n=1 Tax=Pseudomonas serbiensis TaxID=3064350 RepID=A0ABT9CVI9_9PSED|nr:MULTISPECIES: hypothetical protein [Pseudomonas]MBX8548830.1 hypothetical protein [Pseudomonas cichorii]MBX8587466.1 hypothetical protein [Pseudomonas cichorii]MDO7929194.1 hypothetical protein [Pseudomonas sp. KFB-138]
MDGKVSHWYQFRASLLSRTVKPAKHPTFVMFFALGIVVFGGIGIWVEILRLNVFLSKEATFTSVCFAINVFYPSLGCASMLQFIVGNYPKALKAFGCLLCFIFIGACLLIGLRQLYTPIGLCVEIALSALALWAWWIANAENPDYLDADDATAYGPVDTNTPLPGDLNGFKVD